MPRARTVLHTAPPRTPGRLGSAGPATPATRAAALADVSCCTRSYGTECRAPPGRWGTTPPASSRDRSSRLAGSVAPHSWRRPLSVHQVDFDRFGRITLVHPNFRRFPGTSCLFFAFPQRSKAPALSLVMKGPGFESPRRLLDIPGNRAFRFEDLRDYKQIDRGIEALWKRQAWMCVGRAISATLW